MSDPSASEKGLKRDRRWRAAAIAVHFEAARSALAHQCTGIPGIVASGDERASIAVDLDIAVQHANAGRELLPRTRHVAIRVVQSQRHRSVIARAPRAAV